MSENLDHLSIEELQSQLVQIQRRIQEKEKQQVIEKIADLLQQRDPAFIRTVLDLIEGKKDIHPGEKPRVKLVVLAEEKPKKEGAYLRNGKIFFGIQEIKFTKFDKNQVLRISKEGKGLPPRVDAFPDEIRIALLALPVRTETTSPSPSEMETVVDDRIPPATADGESEPESFVDAEPEPVSQVKEPPTVFLEVPLDADLEDTQVMIEPDPAPTKPARPRSGRKSEPEPKSAKTTIPPPIKPEPLQASLF